LESGKELHRLEGHWNIVRSAAFSPDGRQALSGSRGEMIVWDVATGQERIRFQLPQTFNSVSFTADGRAALSATTDGTLRLWSLSEQAAQGRALAQVGQVQKALELYDKAIPEHPDDYNLPFERARHQARQRHWPQ